MFRDTYRSGAVAAALPAVGVVHERIAAITDPEVAEACTDLVQLTESTGEQLDQLAIVASPVLQPAVLSTVTVETLITDLIGEKAARVNQAHGLFRTLHKSTNNPEMPEATQLLDVLGMLVFGKPAGRVATRQRYGAAATQAQHLIDFWHQENAVLDTEQLKTLRAHVMQPVQQVVDQNTRELRGAEGISMERSIRLLQLRSSIDPSVDLSTIKFLVFSNIVACAEHPLLQGAWNRIHDKGSSTRVKLEASTTAPYYHAVHLLTRLDDPASARFEGVLGYLRDNHTRGRFLRVPSREFKEVFNRLSILCRTYRDLRWCEGIMGQLPDLNVEAHMVIRRETTDQANTLTMNTTEALKNTYNNVAGRHNARLAVSDVDDEVARAPIWRDSLEAETFINGCARYLLAKIEMHGFNVAAHHKTALKHYAESTITKTLEEANEARSKGLLQAEIVPRLAAFEALDTQYQLSNKQLRIRRPGALSLAKQLSELLNGNNTLAEETTRELAGLILGAYWERTGPNAAVEQLAERYLADADELRQLQAELVELGQPQSSRLLKLINLVDEMIDSGFFDKNPELGEQFADFLLAYMITKDGPKPVTAPTEAVELTSTTPQGNGGEEPLPVETLRQATYEDLEVFPPSSSVEEIICGYRERLGKDDLPRIEWERIRKIIELRDHCIQQGLETEFVRTKHASWQVLPFFVLAIRIPKDEYGVAVVESPVYGNATYIYREAADRLPWRDVVQLERHEARELGAVAAVHVDSQKLDRHFLKVWDRVISELTILR